MLKSYAWIQTTDFWVTLGILVIVHARLLIFEKSSTLHDLIRTLHDYQFSKYFGKKEVFLKFGMNSLIKRSKSIENSSDLSKITLQIMNSVK